MSVPGTNNVVVVNTDLIGALMCSFIVMYFRAARSVDLLLTAIFCAFHFFGFQIFLLIKSAQMTEDKHPHHIEGYFPYYFTLIHGFFWLYLVLFFYVSMHRILIVHCGSFLARISRSAGDTIIIKTYKNHISLSSILHIFLSISRPQIQLFIFMLL